MTTNTRGPAAGPPGPLPLEANGSTSAPPDVIETGGGPAQEARSRRTLTAVFIAASFGVMAVLSVPVTPLISKILRPLAPIIRPIEGILHGGSPESNQASADHTRAPAFVIQPLTSGP